MKFITRTAVLTALVVGATAAHAALTYNVTTARVTYNTGEVEDLATLQAGSENQSINFYGDTSPIYVASVNTERTSALVEIEYEVTSDTSINALNLLFTGWNFGTGRIDYREVVFDMEGNEVASTSGALFGNNTPFTQVDDLIFSEGLTSYRVTKVFNLAIDPQSNDVSLSTLGIIEQNAVPEPATMAVMGIGALGLIARRRRK